MNSIISVFPNADLRCGHTGLAITAADGNKSADNLKPGQFLLFINRKQTAFKLLAFNNTLVHYRSPAGRIDLRAIQYLPQCFTAGKFNYDIALKRMFEKTLRKKS